MSDLPPEKTHSDGAATAVLSVTDLVVELPLGLQRKVHAVSGVSFEIGRDETLGLVGESGCGKSTLAKALVRLVSPLSGKVLLSGQDVTRARGKALRSLRRNAQLIFQDPISSLNPRRTVLASLLETMSIWSTGDSDRAVRLLEQVGLDPSLVANRLPTQLSGGQCQRVSVARALSLSPSLLICDEPVSALDVSVQAQILNLLQDIREHHKLATLFISHDLSVVRNISNRIAVMYMGKLCELGSANEVYYRPLHPYTRLLLDSVPGLRSAGTGEPHAAGAPSAVNAPSAINPPTGCRFHTRCPFADDICSLQAPPMLEITPGHAAACHHPLT